jgi:hypothetical protein
VQLATGSQAVIAYAVALDLFSLQNKAGAV